MTKQESAARPARRRLRVWIRRGFLTWAIVSTTFLANSFRTRGVDSSLLASSATINVQNEAESLRFLAAADRPSGLIFICGSGVAAKAYVPMLRPIADEGFSVFIVKLPFRLAPLESHKVSAIERVRRIMVEHSTITRWVVAGHSLGGALACRIVRDHPESVAGLVLVGTTHPKIDDLSSLTIPVAKVYGSKDGVAPIEKIQANKRLLPDHTTWVEIEGGNHSQFGHYGHQLLDGVPDVSRDEQQDQTRVVLLDMLHLVDRG